MSNDTNGCFQNLHFQVPAQQLQLHWVCLAGALLLWKVQTFVAVITDALRPDPGGCQVVSVSHRSQLGVESTHQSLMAEGQSSYHCGGGLSASPNQLLQPRSQRDALPEDGLEEIRCYRSSLLARRKVRLI